MSPVVVALITFVCTFTAAIAGMRVRPLLPPSNIDGESRDAVRAIMGLVATMTAPVLGLITASSKSYFDSMDAVVRQTATELLLVDRELRSVGPAASDIRAKVKQWAQARVEHMWPHTIPGSPDTMPTADVVESLADAMRSLGTDTELQRDHLKRADALAEELMQMRWQLIASPAAQVPTAFLVVLVFWLTAILFFFGICAPPHVATAGALLVCSISVAAALFS